jgi:hypothetical protein
VLATLKSQLCLSLALCALQSQDDLLGSLSLLVEDWLGLTTITRLLSVVTALSLCEEGSLALSVIGSIWYSQNRALQSVVESYLSGLVLGDLVLGVLLAVSALAVGASGLWNVDLKMGCQFLFARICPIRPDSMAQQGSSGCNRRNIGIAEISV